MFFLVVLAHTDEQYNNLLKTRKINNGDQCMPIKQILYTIYLTKIIYTFRSYTLLELRVHRKLDYSPL